MLALSFTDLVFISVDIGITTGFRNTYFLLYYPALLGLSLVATSWRVSFGATTVVASVYAGMSLTLVEHGLATQIEAFFTHQEVLEERYDTDERPRYASTRPSVESPTTWPT